MTETLVQVDRETIAANIGRVRERVDIAARQSGRTGDDIEIVAVSKTFPREMVDVAWELGIRTFGENRVQEAAQKFAPPRPDEMTLRLIGPLQTNKARLAVATFDRIDSVDRASLINALEREATRADRTIPVLLQVNIGREPQKSGCDPDEAASLIDRLRESERLRIDGLMAIPPVVASPEDARPWFRALRELRDAIVRDRSGFALPVLSMGMSGDFEAAILEGATQIRIGSAIFGARYSAPRNG